jgi:FkbM family methyltransferase
MNLIFDIGYNEGEFTEACFTKYPTASVIAVEANPNLCNMLQRNFSLNYNFLLLNNLVSNVVGEGIDFYINPSASGISTASTHFMQNSRFTKGSKYIGENSTQWAPPIKVESITIDSMIERYGMPDLIKIDVEGYELNVLKGLTQKANDICFEWHEEEKDNLYQILEHLQSIGYTQFGVIGYFEEGDVFPTVTFSDKGDPYLEYPKNFYTLEDLQLDTMINSERRINYGMFFAK